MGQFFTWLSSLHDNNLTLYGVVTILSMGGLGFLLGVGASGILSLFGVGSKEPEKGVS